MTDKIMEMLDTLETNIGEMGKKADAERTLAGSVSADTKSAIEALGIKQREFADTLLQIQQKASSGSDNETKDTSWGEQFIKGEMYKAFVGGSTQKARMEVKNTITTAVGNVFSQRMPGMVGGAFRALSLEALLTSLPTTSNAIDYVRENVFTNSAAETAEGAQKPESAITTTPASEPVATVAHWIKISRQLAADAPAFSAYVNLRMVYGVNLRVENQIIAGNGTAPNMSGFTKAGNFTAHGYSAAAIGAINGRIELIRRMIADAALSDYPADTVILNPADWALIELIKDSQNRYIIGNPASSSEPRIWGLPVVVSNAMPADNVLVAALGQAANFHNREGVVIEMSDSDSDNFTKNLITVRAERRCALVVERPAAVRYGDLTPA